MRGHKDGFHLTVRQFRSLNVLQPLRIPTPAARPRSCRSDRASCYLRRGTRMAPAATVDRRRYPDARLPDVLVDGLGGRCNSMVRTSALGGSPLNLFSEVVATLIKVRFYGMSALPPKNGHRQLDRPCPKSAKTETHAPQQLAMLTNCWRASFRMSSVVSSWALGCRGLAVSTFRIL